MNLWIIYIYILELVRLDLFHFYVDKHKSVDFYDQPGFPLLLMLDFVKVPIRRHFLSHLRKQPFGFSSEFIMLSLTFEILSDGV